MGSQFLNVYQYRLNFDIFVKLHKSGKVNKQIIEDNDEKSFCRDYNNYISHLFMR